MRYRITFIAGFAVGYVLGAKAGKARYEQIAHATRRLVESPAAQETAGAVGAQVRSAGRTVRSKISERIPVDSVKDFLARPTEEEDAQMRQQEEADRSGVPGR